ERASFFSRSRTCLSSAFTRSASSLEGTSGMFASTYDEQGHEATIVVLRAAHVPEPGADLPVAVEAANRHFLAQLAAYRLGFLLRAGAEQDSSRRAGEDQ